jgi:hypothetical protein
VAAVPTSTMLPATAESLLTVGKLVCLYAELEFATRRFIDALLRQRGIDSTPCFQPPMRTLRRLVYARYGSEPAKIRKFRRWRNRVHKLQARRNTLIHGAWIDERGALRFRKYARATGVPAAEISARVSPAQMAKDLRCLRLDIAAVDQWTVALAASGTNWHCPRTKC